MKARWFSSVDVRGALAAAVGQIATNCWHVGLNADEYLTQEASRE
jgi:hypothetical protein